MSPKTTAATAATAVDATVRGPFSFAFDTADLASGVVVYTPAADEVILHAWIETITVWDGTTPYADFGQGNTGEGGWLAANSGGFAANLQLGRTSNAGAEFSQGGASIFSQGRTTSAAPIRLWVTQDGLRGGADPGSTQGEARFYIVTANSVAL